MIWYNYHMYKETRKKYMQSPNGLLRRMYARQVSSSKERGHEPPDYSFDELEKWAYENGFYRAFALWEKNNFIKDLTPSIDRLFDNRPYTINNLYRVCSWQDNKLRGEKMRQLLATNGKAVRQIDKDSGVIVREYKSINWASKLNCIPATNICKVLRGKLKSAGGYYWKYV